jgi:fructokinase
MTMPIFVLGEALMDCIAQPDGRLLPCMGGSPFNLARAAALRGANVAYLNPLSNDLFGQGMAQLLQKDGVQLPGGTSRLPTSLAVVQVTNGQPSYGFYREGIADRDYSVDGIVGLLRQQKTLGILHTGSLLLIPPEHSKVVAILKAAREMGWTIAVCASPARGDRPDRLAESQRRRPGNHGFCGRRDQRISPLGACLARVA